ncbi:Membrane protein involved in the export of O-antigen and teichoic acid [Blastococcus mobilis]|uniref:Membrane protein involved in the export of O-antigen and teichoic acid n=1 Tax=Blastococcus mobilis TaxID=1938746 RepID=A0A238Z1X3_9ACTN|nr:Membrane protein involved in the export of O-antigen and teichoic acid [Blastococcus mobilis]
MRPTASDEAVASTMSGLFGRDSLYLLFWFLQVLVGALATPLATRLLGAPEFGTFAAANALMQVLYVVAGLGLQVAVQKYFEERGADAARRLLALGIVAAVAITALADLTGHWWSDALGFGGYDGAVRLAVLWAGASAITATVLALLRSQDRLLGFSVVSLLQSVAAEILALVMLVVLAPTAEAFVLGRLVAQVLAVAVGLSLTRLRSLRPGDLPLVRGALVFGLPLVPAMLGSFVLGAADRFLIQEHLGEAAVAQYSVAYNIAALPMLVLSVLNSVWLPRFFAAGAGADGDAVVTASRDALYRLLAPVMVGLSVAAPLVLRVWAPAEFRPDDLLLVTAVVIVSAVPYTAGLSATRTLLTASRTRMIAGSAVVASVVNVVLNLWWIPVFGILGAALATAAAYSVQHLLLLVPTRGRPLSGTRTRLVQTLAGVVMALLAVLLPVTAPGLVLRAVLAVACLGWFARACTTVRSPRKEAVR